MLGLESSCWVGGDPYTNKGGAIYHGGVAHFPKKNNGVKQLSLLVNWVEFFFETQSGS